MSSSAELGGRHPKWIDVSTPASNGTSEGTRRFMEHGIRPAGVGFGMYDYSVHQAPDPTAETAKNSSRRQPRERYFPLA